MRHNVTVLTSVLVLVVSACSSRNDSPAPSSADNIGGKVTLPTGTLGGAASSLGAGATNATSVSSTSVVTNGSGGSLTSNPNSSGGGSNVGTGNQGGKGAVAGQSAISPSSSGSASSPSGKGGAVSSNAAANAGKPAASGGSNPASSRSAAAGTNNRGGAPSGGVPSTSTVVGGASAGNSTSTGSADGCSANCTIAAAGSCTAPSVRITPVNLGAALSYSTEETGVLPLAIAPLPGGGSRIAWVTGYATNGSSKNSQIHLAQLDCEDKLVGTPVTFEGHDFQDIAEDATGGVVVLTRNGDGATADFCGDVNNLCVVPKDRPACYNMYMVRHDCAGNEQWATKLTSSSASQLPYSAGSSYNYMVWWYQHHGRLAYDGTNYAAYFCDAISVANASCANGAGKIDIHQGDRMQVVGPTGNLLTGHNSFDLGCSHSGFTRILWDPATSKFVMVCKTDNNNRIAQPNPYSTVLPVTLDGSFLGDLVAANGGGYWLTASNSGSLHLLHFKGGAQADQDKVLGTANYPHLVAYGSGKMIAVYSSTLTGNMTAQVFDTSGNEIGSAFAINAPNHPYQAFKSFPDGSAAFATVGASGSTIQIVRVLPCSE